MLIVRLLFFLQMPLNFHTKTIISRKHLISLISSTIITRKHIISHILLQVLQKSLLLLISLMQQIFPLVLQPTFQMLRAS